MTKYIITREEIEQASGLDKAHFLNDNARRINKSLGDMTGMTGLGFHVIEIEPGRESTEYHRHYFEDECVYILQGQAESLIGDERSTVKAGDFIGYPAGGEAHKLTNTGSDTLRCIVVGQRLDHDVADYPHKAKRIFRNQGMPWDLVDLEWLVNPTAGRKK